MGSMVFTFSTGWTVTHFSYAPVLVIAGVLAPMGTAVLLLLAGPIHRLKLEDNQ